MNNNFCGFDRKIIAEYLANLKGVSIEEVSSITEKNVQELYKIKK